MTFKSDIRTRLCSLRQLAFILHLPEYTILEQDDLHWFNLGHHEVRYEINSDMLLYTLPYLLNSQRRLHNHTFAQRPQMEGRINHIEWIVDDDPLSINVSLDRLKHLHSLKWFYVIQVRSHQSQYSSFQLIEIV